MATAPVTYVSVERVIDCRIAVVWEAVSAFGTIDRWIAGVTGCTVDGTGIGAVRTIRLGDRVVREQLEEIDHIAHELRYRILEPHVMPARNIVSTIALTSQGDTRTAILWRSQATDIAVPVEQLGTQIGRFYASSIEGLKRLLAAA